MKLDLDSQKLEEARVWQQRNFDRQVDRIRSILQNFLDQDISQALRFVQYEREDRWGRGRTPTRPPTSRRCSRRRSPTLIFAA